MAATGVAGVLVLVLALLLGGGAPPAPVPGLESPSRIALWGGDITSYAALIAGVLAVGFAMFGERGLAGGAAAGWTALTALQVGFLAWEQHGESATATAQGQALLIQGGLAALAAFGWSLMSNRRAAAALLPVALAALVPAALAGHARAADDRLLASLSLAIHVLAAAMWVGGLFALACIAGWRAHLARYSAVAAMCAFAVALSGVVAALGNVAVGEVFTSRYGAIVALKAVILLGLVAAGWLQRRYVVARMTSGRRAFLALATFELTTMAIVMALATALTETPPPGG